MSIPQNSVDGFEYEEINMDEKSVNEAESLEVTAEVLKQTNDSEFVPEPSRRSSSSSSSSSQKQRSPIPTVVTDFVHNILVKMGMSRTLDCFQTECFEMLQKGTLRTNQVASVRNLCVHNELKNVQRERVRFKQAAYKAVETIKMLQKEKDFQQLQHNHILQEKIRLIGYIQRLKRHYESYGPALKQLHEKYKTALRQKMLARRVRVSRQVHNLDSVMCNSGSSSGTRRFPAGCKTKTLKFSATKSIKAHSTAVNCLALHPRKLLVASVSDDHLWKIWGMPEGKMIMTGEGHTDWLSSCSFHPCGNCLATTSGDTTVRIWNSAKSCCVLTLEGHSRTTCGCSFHSSGDFVASCSMDNTAKLWDLNSERCCYTLTHADSVNSISFAPFSNILLTCSADKTVSLWDARAGVCAQTFYGHRHACKSATFNHLGDMIASCDAYGIVKFWDIRNMSAIRTLDTGPHPSNQVAFSPNGQMLAVASNNHEVKLVDVVSSRVASLFGHNDAVQSVIFDHNGEYLISAGHNGEIFIWSIIEVS